VILTGRISLYLRPSERIEPHFQRAYGPGRKAPGKEKNQKTLGVSGKARNRSMTEPKEAYRFEKPGNIVSRRARERKGKLQGRDDKRIAVIEGFVELGAGSW
jgi:hypothetical protein